MKFTYYLEKIAGVSIYPVISLLLFVAFFTIVTLWVLRTDKRIIEHIENLPLDNEK
ncbi:MAG: CcoQ/FixQ family Cbb3-type cytochrome c oxidase assembly chaperone [Ferruginibacter sp.]